MPANGRPSNIDPAEYERIQARLHPALRDSFVAMPSDPCAPLSERQLDALLGGDLRALADIMRLALPAESASQVTTDEIAVEQGRANVN